jgi:hypothetical protein
VAKPLHPKEVATVQELAVSTMLEIGGLRQLLFEKGIITEQEVLTRFERLSIDMKQKRGR